MEKRTPFAEWLHGQEAVRSQPRRTAPAHYNLARPIPPRSGNVSVIGPKNLEKVVKEMISSENEGEGMQINSSQMYPALGKKQAQYAEIQVFKTEQ